MITIPIRSSPGYKEIIICKIYIAPNSDLKRVIRLRSA